MKSVAVATDLVHKSCFFNLFLSHIRSLWSVAVGCTRNVERNGGSLLRKWLIQSPPPRSPRRSPRGDSGATSAPPPAPEDPARRRGRSRPPTRPSLLSSPPRVFPHTVCPRPSRLAWSSALPAWAVRMLTAGSALPGSGSTLPDRDGHFLAAGGGCQPPPMCAAVFRCRSPRRFGRLPLRSESTRCWCGLPSAGCPTLPAACATHASVVAVLLRRSRFRRERLSSTLLCTRECCRLPCAAGEGLPIVCALRVYDLHRHHGLLAFCHLCCLSCLLGCRGVTGGVGIWGAMSESSVPAIADADNGYIH
ncbi:uncharacterized protein LOC112875706 [Panicum hallii]|uniref:uncharacterized protein LOC112875706 n=1 Tax=Panicum hallii TaxID=206008 RepID=UPI000DF4E141|nr:uncharacterized protein LOC112875706 [Panicum hallii]